MLNPVRVARCWSEGDAVVEEVLEMRMSKSLEETRRLAMPFAIFSARIVPFQFELLPHGSVAARHNVAIFRVLFPASCVVKELKHGVAQGDAVRGAVTFECEVSDAANSAGGLDGD